MQTLILILLLGMYAVFWYWRGYHDGRNSGANEIFGSVLKSFREGMFTMSSEDVAIKQIEKETYETFSHSAMLAVFRGDKKPVTENVKDYSGVGYLGIDIWAKSVAKIAMQPWSTGKDHFPTIKSTMQFVPNGVTHAEVADQIKTRRISEDQRHREARVKNRVSRRPIPKASPDTIAEFTKFVEGD